MCQDNVKDKSLDIAEAIVRQWDEHDKFRVVEGEDNSESDEVVVARALLSKTATEMPWDKRASAR